MSHDRLSVPHDPTLDGPADDPHDSEWQEWYRTRVVNTNLDDVWVCLDCAGSAHLCLVMDSDLVYHWQEHRRERGAEDDEEDADECRRKLAAEEREEARDV